MSLPNPPQETGVSNKIQQALADLVERLADGGEFPDEAWRVARKHGVNQAELEAAYDAQPAAQQTFTGA